MSDIVTTGGQVPTLQSLSLSQFIETAIASLSVDSTRDDVQGGLLMADSLRSMALDAHSRIRDIAAEWIVANGEFECNGVRYYVGPKKVTRCKDKGALLDTMIQYCGGDLSAVSEFLSSEPWKHGAIGKELPADQFTKLFDVTYEDELKEGKPKLRTLDTKFIR